ncbi:MAG: hypothetical protein SGJ04_00540 [Bacteroidota bacterium]|nr:hypothetical protein [Bacteroidota bacterium]
MSISLLNLSVYLFFLLFISKPSAKLGASFYYFNVDIDDKLSNDSLSDKFNPSCIYLRYFDVNWSAVKNQPTPTKELNTEYLNRSELGIFKNEYIPVIYIVGSTFDNLVEVHIPKLVGRVLAKSDRITLSIEEGFIEVERSKFYDTLYNQGLDYEVINTKLDSIRQVISGSRVGTVKEFQIDCDWTAKNRDKYFKFLTILKDSLQKRNMKLSVTIRLYPYKYSKKMGVPPVDKGVLMCYNLGQIQNSNTKNSVFDVKELDKYLKVKSYPLPLDVALPIFGWYVWHTGKECRGIIHLSDKTRGLENNPNFTKLGNELMSKVDTVIENKYIRVGDQLRMEIPKKKELIEAKKLINNKVKFNKFIYFNWEPTSLYHYEEVFNTSN